MNEPIPAMSLDASSNGAPNAVDKAIAELERRVLTLETTVAALPDAKLIEANVTERVKASLPPPPPPPPPVDSSQAPGFRDIEIPIPSAQTLVNTAKATWMLFELFAELRMLFWTLFDRRYHVAWITRFITIAMVALIMTSQWWVPLAKVDFIGPILDKIADLLLGLILFMVLSFETRRYKEWRSQKR